MGGAVRIRHGYPALFSMLISCGPRMVVDPRQELRPCLQSLTIAIVEQPGQQYVDGVPIGPPPRPPARLERRADTLLLRGSIPERGIWPPAVNVTGAERVIDVTLSWRFFAAGSVIQIRGDKSPDWEVALAPVAAGRWRVRVTQRDSTDTVLSSWTVDTTLDR
jgi:hypothetical protein